MEASLGWTSISEFNLLPLNKDTAGYVQLGALSESSILEAEHSNEAEDISRLSPSLRFNVLR